jgi:hemolysin activation/secretion protein
VRSRLIAATKAPVNIPRLNQALQLLQLNPLFSRINANLTAGSASGRDVLLVNIKEADPLNSVIVVDNKEPPSVGSFGSTAILAHNNLLGIGDRLSAAVGITEGVNNYQLDYTVPINSRDGTLSFSYDNGRNSVIEEPFAPIGIRGKSQSYSISLRQPIVRSPTEEFALSLSANLRQSRTFLLDDEPFSFTEGPEKGESKVSTLRFSQDWLQRRSSSVLAARSQFSVGLGVLGATVNDTGTDGRFFSWLGQVQWVQAINRQKDALLVGRVAAQLTPDSLLPLEQFAIGGADSVRGYRTNQSVASNGIFGSVEVRLPIVRAESGFGLIQLTPFVDVGTVWGNELATDMLLSTGLGLRWQLGNSLSARIDWGIPLISIDRQGNSLQDDGISFSLQVNPF